MSQAQFASRLLAICGTIVGWATSPLLDRPKDYGGRVIRPRVVSSYLCQIRQMLDELEKDACP